MSAPAVSVVELVGNPRAGSRTRSLADLVVRALIARAGGPAGTGQGSASDAAPPDAQPTVVELGEAVAVGFDADPARATAPVSDLFGRLKRSRLLVVATPTYKGTYSGLLKLVLDQLNQGDLVDTVAVPVAIAGAPAHRESVAAALSALLVELGAQVPAPAVALLEGELADQVEHVETWAAEHAPSLWAAVAEASQRATERATDRASEQDRADAGARA